MGSGSTNTAQQQTVAQPSAEQQQLLNSIMPGLAGAATTPMTLPGFGMTAQFNPNQTAAQNMAVGEAGTQGNVAGSAAGGSQFLTGGNVLYPGTNPALEAYIQSALAPMQQGFTENTLPAIREAGTGVGQPGSTREGIAEGLASKGEQLAESTTASGIANQGYQSGLNAMNQALATSPAVTAEQTAPAGTVAAVGAEQQQQEQANLNEMIQRYMFPQTEGLARYGDIASILAGFPGGTSTTTASGNQNPSLASLLIGGTAAAGGLAGGLGKLMAG
jgi:hypothetical protein